MKSILLIGIFFLSIFSYGQIATVSVNQEIEKTIKDFFKAMKENDTLLLRSCLTTDAVLFSIHKTKDNRTKLNIEKGQRFIDAVGTPKKEIWNEYISELQIESDGLLATAWMNYQFYIDSTFSHCGANAFQFILIDNKWMIFEIADTRKINGCKEE